MLVLGIESSCDETAAALVNDRKEILASTVLTQSEHKNFGGVVPELAARAHLEHIDEIIDDTFKSAHISPQDIDAVAVAAGPGLIGGVTVGVMAAKALALALNKPFIALNHLEAHALVARLHTDIQYPYLLLLTSGGHCQILVVEGVGKFKRLGTTIDDAAGEAFDKVAKMLGLGYPGGPMVEKMASLGDASRFVLPRPLYNSPDCDLSFSGLKTAVRKIIESYSPDGIIEHAIMRKRDIADICACFQTAVADIFVHKLERAINYFKKNYPTGQHLVVAGGVAANLYLRARLQKLCDSSELLFAAPPINLCTDNGVMIAWAGVEHAINNMFNDLDFKPRPRWPLDENAPKAAGAGGVKA